MLKKAVNSHLKTTIKRKEVINPLRRHELELDSVILALYNEAYFCLHAGLYNSALSMQFQLLERLTKDVYKIVFPEINEEEVEEEDWGKLLDNLQKYFQQNKWKILVYRIDLVIWIKRTGMRNKHIHVDIKEITKKLNIPAYKVNLKERIMEQETLLGNSPVVKKYEAEFYNKTVSFLANYLFPYTTEAVKEMIKIKKYFK